MRRWSREMVEGMKREGWVWPGGDWVTRQTDDREELSTGSLGVWQTMQDVGPLSECDR